MSETVICVDGAVITSSLEVTSLNIYPSVFVMVAVTEYVPNGSALGIARDQFPLFTTSPFEVLYNTLLTTTVKLCPAAKVAVPVIVGVVLEVV